MVKKENQVTYITLKYDKKLNRTEDINGVNVIRISSPTRLFFFIAALPVIIREARKTDLIHTSTYSSAIGAWLGGWLCRKKTIITVHEFWGDIWLRLPYLSWIEKRFFRLFERCLFTLKFNQYVAVSDFTKNQLVKAGIHSEKITRIYNGIDYNLPTWNDPGLPFTFTFFGRAGASKGLDILLEASEKMVARHPGVKFKFIISPQTRKIFKKVTGQIMEGPLNKNAALLSELPHEALLKELLSSNCIIIPSLCEGFGFSAVETAAMKIPVISSGMGALPEVVSGQAITTKEYNAESLLLAMEAALAGDYDIIEQRKFTTEDFVRNHLKLYQKMITEEKNDNN